MHAVSPVKWPIERVGASPSWPDYVGNGENPMRACSGSAGVTTCIESTDYSIGYIDAGHGNDAGLPEVRLQNEEGEFLTTVESINRGGLETAERDVLPENADADFSNVTLINRPGKDTWPMVALTYVYVRKDLSWIDPVTRGALIAFFRTLYDPDFIQICVEEYDFMVPSAEIQQYGREAIDELVAANNDTQIWTFERSTTQALVGAGEYVFSTKRESSFKIIDEDELAEALFKIEAGAFEMKQEIESLQTKVTQLNSNLASKDADLDNLRNILSDVETDLAAQDSVTGDARTEVFDDGFGGTEEQQLKTALVLSILSFLFICIHMLYTGYRFFTKA